MSYKKCFKYNVTSSVETDESEEEEIIGRRERNKPPRFNDYAAGKGSTQLILLGSCQHISI